MSSDLDVTEPAVDPRTAGLRGLCGGAVLLPDDARYDESRQAWNQRIDQRPAAVVYPADASEVSEVVRAAARAGLRVAPQCTGHNAGPLGDLDDVVLLRTSAMTRVEVDHAAQTVRVDAGALWSDVVEEASQHGLAALHATSPGVGAVGYSLGGGIGWYARSLGLACNTITAIELVTAGGDQIRADEHTHHDLFWAIRGGGGNFGIITAMEFRLFPIQSVYSGTLTWDLTDVEPVLTAWAEWTRDAPHSATTSLRLITGHPTTDPSPGANRLGRITITGAILETDQHARDLLRPLRALNPATDSFERVPARHLITLLDTPRSPSPGFASAVVLDHLPADAIATLLTLTHPTRHDGSITSELRHLGGALAQPAAHAGALASMQGQYLLQVTTNAPGHQAAGNKPDQSVADAFAPYATSRPNLNFTEQPIEVSSAFTPTDWERLLRIRATVDPEAMILANHPIPSPTQKLTADAPGSAQTHTRE